MTAKLLRLITILLVTIPLTAARDMEFYLTNPSGSKNSVLINPMDGLINSVNNSKKSIYGAFYDISSLQVTDALIKAHSRGVDVKLVTDNDTFSGAAITKILESGIPIVPDTGSGLMHNKFAVIDGTKVFTGSYNITDNCTRRNNNNALLITSPELAAIYYSEFSEMFFSGIFGNRNEEGAFSVFLKKYHVKLGDTDINVYFAPEDNVEKIILGRIKKAEKSVKFLQFTFTSDSVGEALIAKFKEGIDVRGVFEKKGSDSEYSEFIKMKIEGVPVRLDNNRYNMHHKVIIIDDFRVITGSFNISKNANSKNDENIIIIDNAGLATEFTEEFNRIYNESE